MYIRLYCATKTNKSQYECVEQSCFPNRCSIKSAEKHLFQINKKRETTLHLSDRNNDASGRPYTRICASARTNNTLKKNGIVQKKLPGRLLRFGRVSVLEVGRRGDLLVLRLALRGPHPRAHLIRQPRKHCESTVEMLNGTSQLCINVRAAEKRTHARAPSARHQLTGRGSTGESRSR